LKEYSLGIAVFDRDASYDPRTDPIVRVEAGRLRSRLNEYYNTRGREDPIIIELPKGSYAVTVRQRSAKEARRFDWARLRWMLDLRFAGFAAMAVLCAVLAFENRALRARGGAHLPREAQPIWGPLLSSQAETVIVFGSPLFFESEEKRLYVRGYDINDPFDRFRNQAYLGLEKLLGPLSEPRYVYAATGDALALHLLGDYLARYGKRSKALPANLATWDAIKDKNIICVGARRMIPLLERLPVQLDFVLQPDFYVVNLKPRPGEEKSYWTPSHRDAMSYAIIATAPGLAPGREILIFESHASAGIESAVEYMTGQETLRELSGKIEARPGERRSYQILLRVLAHRDQGFKTEYVTHHSTPRPL